MNRSVSRHVSAWSVAAILVGSAAGAASLNVPAGFEITSVAGPDVRFPMFATLDDQGRLYVTESSGQDLYAELSKQVRGCRIRCLVDRDGDGRYETSRLFAEGLVPSMGVVWHAGKIYAADPPDLVTLEDTDGDGRADKRTVVLTGFGHTDNGSLHGLRFGPDGWLYLTTGEPDGYRLKRTDGSVLEGKSGALLRCRPDGSGVEVVSRGFENLVEVVFLPTGEIIGTDNWFQLPADGIRDALVHLVEGALYPYAPDTGTPQPITGDPLPAVARYPAVALSGLELYRGTAFPAAMHGSLFSAQHNTRKVVRHQLQRVGSTFRSVDEDFVWTDDPDVHPSDVLEGTDGSLIVVDTGSWYIHHCPTGRIRRNAAPGGIYRVRFTGNQDPAASAPAKPIEAEALAAELRAMGRRGDRSGAARLGPLLRHPAPYVQLAAAEALAACGSSKDVPVLIDRLGAAADRFIEHALVHALYRLADVGQLTAALGHADPRVQRAALVLLDRPPHRTLSAEAVLERAFAADGPLRRAAQDCLQRHPEWVGQALPVMTRLLSATAPSTGELDSLRAFAVAFHAQPTVADLVAKAVGDEIHTAEPQRLALLEAMARTPKDKLSAGSRAAFAIALRSPSVAVRTQALRGIKTLRLDGLDVALRAVANDTKTSDALRVQALRSLVRSQATLDADPFAVLLRELGPGVPQPRRSAAMDVLGVSRLDDPQFVRFIQAAAGDLMLSPASVVGAVPPGGLSPETARTLLGYLQARVEAGWQLAEQQLAAVAAAVPMGRAGNLEALRAGLARAVEQQHGKLVTLEPLLRGGDPERGRIAFGRKAGCVNCHQVAGQGGSLGPDLTKIGAIRAGRDLIESIVMPSATFAQGYETYSATLRSGEIVTGIRVRQPDDAVVLRDASGAETRLDASEGATVERQKLSLMPEGLLGGLSEAETSDLLAYLQSLR